MLVEVYLVRVEYTRTSKNNKTHVYYRQHKVARLVCDSCGVEFERRASMIDPRRLVGQYLHVCPHCDPKRFAQSKGVESRRFWNTTVDLDVGLDKI